MVTKALPSLIAGLALTFGVGILWWQGVAYSEAGSTLSNMIKDHQTIIGAVLALCTASLAFLAATANARAQIDARRTEQAEQVEALRAEVAFRMFRVFAGVKGWYDAAVGAASVDYNYRLESILESMQPILDSAISTIDLAWREIGKISVPDQRDYRKFLGEAELFVDAYRTSVQALRPFTGKEAAYYELGWAKTMASFKASTDSAWQNAPRVQAEIKRFAEA